MDAKLLTVDSRSFTLEQAMTYLHASDLASASRKAMEKHDYAEALSLSMQTTKLVQSVIDDQKKQHAS
jgi:hypothetical protein